MAAKRKTWGEKLADKKDLPKTLILQKNFPCYNAVHKMGAEAGDPVVLVNPSEIVAIMKRIPKGKLITIVEICQTIARKYKVKGCCSLTTGIFIMTAANAAAEDPNLDIPYWRTLKSGGMLNEKFPGGAAGHKKLLIREGYTIIRKGKKFFVKDFESYLPDPRSLLPDY